MSKKDNRVNMYVKDEDIWNYINSESKKFGLTKSAFVNMCVGKIKYQDEKLIDEIDLKLGEKSNEN